MKASHKFESLALNTMASGHFCLNLSERISWEAFPAFAETFTRSVGARITRKSDGPDLRLWEVCIDEHPVRLVFDDFPVMVSLESGDDQGDTILTRLHHELEQAISPIFPQNG